MKSGQFFDDRMSFAAETVEVRSLRQALEQKRRARPRRADDQGRPVEPWVGNGAARADRSSTHEARRWRGTDVVTEPLAATGASAGPKISESQTVRMSKV